MNLVRSIYSLEWTMPPRRNNLNLTKLSNQIELKHLQDIESTLSMLTFTYNIITFAKILKKHNSTIYTYCKLEQSNNSYNPRPRIVCIHLLPPTHPPTYPHLYNSALITIQPLRRTVLFPNRTVV